MQTVIVSKLLLSAFYGAVGGIVGFAVAWLAQTLINALSGQDVIAEGAALLIAVLAGVGAGVAMGAGYVSAARTDASDQHTEHSDDPRH